MAAKNKGPGAGGGKPLPDIPKILGLPTQVDVAGKDNLYQFQSTGAPTPTDSKALVQKVADTFVTTVFENGLSPAFIWMVKMWLQIVLMHLGMPPTLKMLAHSPNADTKLMPAIDSLLKTAPAIADQDSRALKGVDLPVVTANQLLLGQVREILNMLMVAFHCVEAGETHLEQYLDGVARKVLGKLGDLLDEDYQMGVDLKPLAALSGDSVQQGLETKKFKARLTAEGPGTEEPPPGGPAAGSTGQGGPGTTAGPVGSGSGGVVAVPQGGAPASGPPAAAPRTGVRKRKPTSRSPKPPKLPKSGTGKRKG